MAISNHTNTARKLLMAVRMSMLFMVVFVFALSQVLSTVSALSPEQKKLYDQNILYYDIDECSSGGEITAGSGDPKGTTFPNLSPEAMSKAIDKFIKRENPNSKLNGVGETIVASAKNSNINPFLIVAQAYMESGLADPGVSDIFDRGNNAFGRSALPSQPHIVSQGAAGAPSIWYKWSSVKASVDYTAHENKNAAGGGDIASYLREQYGNILNGGDLDKYIKEYAPDGNEATYVTNITKWVKEMANLANSSGGGASLDIPGGSGVCCEAGGDGALVGSENAGRAFNYFISNGLSDVAAAGLVGNFQAESGEDLNTHSDNGTHKGIVQWEPARWANLVESANGNEYDLKAQLDFVMEELNGDYRSVLNSLKNASDSNEAAQIVFDDYEKPGDDTLPKRQGYARSLLNQFGGGLPGVGGGGCSGSIGDANMKKTITVDKPGRFITLPSRYSCSDKGIRIDSRIAAAVAYIMLKYNACLTAGLEGGHKSHGAGLGIDVVPKDGSSRAGWKNSVEAAARDIGWFGDSATDPKGSKNSCANYDGGDGECMHAVHPDKFPKWLRWMGYNGAVCHGDRWHIYGGCSPHLHIGWDTPNGDGVSSDEISEPRQSVYTFPAPVPDDLLGLVD